MSGKVQNAHKPVYLIVAGVVLNKFVVVVTVGDRQRAGNSKQVREIGVVLFFPSREALVVVVSASDVVSVVVVVIL
jgi:hypothetical protein